MEQDPAAHPGRPADYIDQGYFARHLHKMRATYQQRHRQIVESLDDRFADHLKPVPSAAGVELQPLSMYDVGPPSQPGIVLGSGAIPTADIEEGLSRLRRRFDG